MVFPHVSHKYIKYLSSLRGRNSAQIPIKGEKFGVKGEKFGASSVSYRGMFRGRNSATPARFKGRAWKRILSVFSPYL